MKPRYGRAGGATLLVFFLAAGVRGQDRSAVLPYSIPGHGSLKLKVPEEWRVASKSLHEPASLQLRFGPSNGEAFSLQVTAVWLDSEKLAKATPEKIKADTTGSADGLLQQAVEKVATVQELPGAATLGYYFSLTDRAPAPGEYKYLTQGISLTGEVMLVFTFLHHEMPSPEKDRALRMLADAIHSR